MDNIKETTEAVLYSWDEQNHSPFIIYKGTLKEVNDAAAKIDTDIARKIENDEIDGLIFMSADPHSSNQLAVQAAARKSYLQPGQAGHRWQRLDLKEYMSFQLQERLVQQIGHEL
ncbi:hypothetical protein ACI2OX_11700 [Bacillus sp. N9]